MQNPEELKAEIRRLEREKRDLLWGVEACLVDLARPRPTLKSRQRTSLVINRLMWMLSTFDHERAQRIERPE